MKKTRRITQDRAVYFINYVLLTLLLVVVLYPIIYIVSCSFSSGDALMSAKVRFLPVEPTLESYETVFLFNRVYCNIHNKQL